MFKRFMKLKYQLPVPIGGVQVCELDFISNSLVSSRHYEYQQREVNLAVLDMREIERSKPTAT